ncbi:MAG: hypothetical protein H6907_12180 [Hyphomicrobiales bacterium]|nr:hypothetical protein [Hyphomicrobiales bacterium]
MTAGLAAGLAIVAAIVAWRLSAGPISLGFLTPYLERELNGFHESFRIGLDDTVLTWAGAERALDVRVVNVRATRPDGSLIAGVPELSVSLSARAMLQGVVAPQQIELFRPRLRLRRKEDGRLELGFAEAEGAGTGGGADLVAVVLDELAAAPARDNPMSYLTRFNIVDADLVVEDRRLGTTWQAERVQMTLTRSTAGVDGQLSFALPLDGATADISVAGEYKAASRRTDVGVSFGQINPRALVARLPMAEDLRRRLPMLAGPVRGTVTASVAADGSIESVGFDVTGEAAVLTLPAPVAQDLPLRALHLQGRVDGAQETVEVTHLELDLGPDGGLELPPPAKHRWPLRTATLKGRYFMATGRAEIDRLEADLDGASVAIAANLDDPGPAMAINAKGILRNVKVNELKRYWPRAWGTDAWNWCATHMADGRMSEASAHVILRGDGKGGFAVEKLNGEMALDGVSVDYLPPMPKVRKAAGKAQFDTKVFTIAVEHGEVEGLTVTKGDLYFTGLDEKDQYLTAKLGIEGPVRSALTLIDHEPLGFAGEVGIDPAVTRGQSSTVLNLHFILEKDVTLEQVDVSAVSQVTEVGIKNALLKQDISDGRLDLRVDKDGMDVIGNVEWARIPAQLAWHENFAADAEFRSRYDLTAFVGEVGTLGLGFDLDPFPGDFIRGAVGAEVNYTVFDDNRQRLQAKADLADVSLVFPALGWTKDKGVEGTATIDVNLRGEAVTGIPYFGVTAGDLAVLGAATYTQPDGAGRTTLKQIDFSRISYGRTDLKGTVAPGADGVWSAAVQGASFDLAPLWSEIMTQGSRFTEEGEEGMITVPYRLKAQVDRVWFSEDKFVSSVNAALERRDDIWRQLVFTTEFPGGHAFALTISPKTETTRQLAVHAEDAGQVLKTFGIYDNMVGGVLDVAAVINDGQAGSPVGGKVMVEDFHVVDAPTLAHLVSILALTGILESLQGKGLSFLQLNAPFEFRDGVLTIADARAYGLSLGVTASGTYYRGAEVINLEGTVVPAYAINSVAGRIPVLGDLLTGGEEGGGVFAATYTATGPVEAPDISVNPLSALAPGFLRNLFGFFDAQEAKGTGATPDDAVEDAAAARRREDELTQGN